MRFFSQYSSNSCRRSALEMCSLQTLYQPDCTPYYFHVILGQLLKPLCMSPTLPEPPIGQGYQDADGQHLRISLRLVGRHIDECADACIFVMDKVSDVSYQCRLPLKWSWNSHTKSCLTLWRPEGRDLKSTTPSSSTIKVNTAPWTEGDGVYHQVWICSRSVYIYLPAFRQVLRRRISGSPTLDADRT
jgi:hypothetical protein